MATITEIKVCLFFVCLSLFKTKIYFYGFDISHIFLVNYNNFVQN